MQLSCCTQRGSRLLVLLAASSAWATLAIAVLSMVFVTQTPTWSCTRADDVLCQQQIGQLGTSAALCRLQPGQYTWDAPGSSLVSTFNLVCGSSWKVGLANASFFIGYTLGSTLFGWLADKHGRKLALVVSAASAGGASMLCGLSSSFDWYVAAHILQGVCCSGMPIACYVLSTESVGPAFRGRAGTASQMVYHLGEWLLPAMAFMLQDWRHLYAAVALCCMLTAVLGLLVPESPRWQLLHGREAQAVYALEWMARLNRRQLSPAVVQQLQSGVWGTAGHMDFNGETMALTAGQGSADTSSAEGQQQEAQAQGDCSSSLVLKDQSVAIQLTKAVQQQQQQQGKEHHAPEQHDPEQLHSGSHAVQPAQQDTAWMVFTDPLLATFFWVSAWVCTVMATAFFTANLATEKLQGSLYVNFVLTSLGELPATIIGAVAVDALGRRPTITTGLAVTGASCCVCALLNPGAWSTVLASIGKAFCSSTWSLAYIYAAELMPTSVRSSALAGSNQAARLGGAVAPFIIYMGDSIGHPKLPFLLVGCAAAATALMTSLLPETHSRGQPDTMADLHRMYGRSSMMTAANSHGSSSPGAAGLGCEAAPGDAAGQGVLQRVLSRAAGSGSWDAAALRARSWSRAWGSSVWSRVETTGDDEAELVVVGVHTPPGSTST